MQERTRTRVILAATSFADANPALDVAIRLAKLLEGQLHGCLIEDEAVLHFSAAPYSKTVPRRGGEAQDVTRDKMISAFLQDAQAFEQTLAQAAREAQVEWSFVHHRGNTASLAGAVSEEGDLVILGYERPQFAQGDVILLSQRDTVPESVLGLAGEIARELDCALTVAHIARAQANAIRPRDARSLNAIDLETLDQALKYLGRTAPTAVLLDTALTVDTDLNAVLHHARCPVFLLASNAT